MFHLYGLLIGLGILAGMHIVFWHAKKNGVSTKYIEQVMLWVAVPAIIGARLYHVSTDWQLYENRSFFQLLEIWNGGLGFFGALIGGIIGLVLYTVKNTKTTIRIGQNGKQNTQFFKFFVVLDLLAVGAPLAQAIGRIGNYFNQELYGLPTTLPWSISIDGKRYHPLFAYEGVLNLLVFCLLHWLMNNKKLGIGKGQYACLYVVSYGLIRFWLEFLRPDTARRSGVFDIFSIAQWVSLTLVFIALSIFWLRRHADSGVEWELRTLV